MVPALIFTYIFFYLLYSPSFLLQNKKQSLNGVTCRVWYLEGSLLSAVGIRLLRPGEGWYVLVIIKPASFILNRKTGFSKGAWVHIELVFILAILIQFWASFWISYERSLGYFSVKKKKEVELNCCIHIVFPRELEVRT